MIPDPPLDPPASAAAVTCPECGGTGESDGYALTRCPLCRGEGVVVAAVAAKWHKENKE